MKNLWLYGLLVFCITCSPAIQDEDPDSQNMPNVIYILADDLGYGDLTCYGQSLFTTPNIDRLAREGIKFLNHYSGATVCAPSRSSLMTGLHTGHTYIRGNKEWQPEGQWPLPDSAVTIAELLQEKGYATGAFGKWGLGFIGTEGDPNSQGFDHFFGYNCQRLAHNYYPYYLWDNDQKIVLEGNEEKGTAHYAPQNIHREALDFVRKNNTRPFFLFYPSVIPHAELVAPENYMKKFRGKFLPEHKYEGVDDGDNYRLGPYGSQQESHAAFAAMIHMLDEHVGDIVDLVDSLGLDENTLIMFTSDNGPHLEGGADPDYFDSNGPFKGYKRDLYEGGIRVPMLARWKGHISPGSTTAHPSAFWDIMPTLGEIAGLEVQDNLDGISFLPTLLGDNKMQEKHEYLYWEFHERGGRQALRRDKWKLVQYDVNRTPQGAPELYDLENDAEEQNNLADENPELVSELLALMKNARVPNEVFKFTGEK